MKIHALRFKNLNSLTGSFTLDFRQGPLAETGIFAITGPTGAGKTTILDALCVALYGQTPRLGAGDSEELMSRHTGDCYAEVDFGVAAGIFRARWAQRRARGNAAGRLQPPAMEIAAVNGGEATIIEDKKSRVPERVAEITGLDFERFTRSMLLAQGSFAAFLHARDSERAELLEKMTGTEIYSQISVNVFERARRERQNITELTVRKESVSLMGTEELEKQKETAAQLECEIKNLSEDLDRAAAHEQWLRNLLELRTALETCRKELDIIEQEKNDHCNDLARLALAAKAVPLRGEFDVVESLKQQCVTIEKEIIEHEKSVPVLEKTKKEHLKQKAEAERTLETFEKEAAQKIAAVDQAVKKDQDIENQRSNLTERIASRDAITEELENLRKQKKQNDAAAAELRDKQNAARVFLDAHGADAGLEQDLPLIKEQLQILAARREILQKKQSALVDYRRSVQTLSRSAAEAAGSFNKAAAEAKEKEDKKEAAGRELETLTGGTPVEQWEEKQKNVEAQKQRFEQLCGLSERIASLDSKIALNEESLSDIEKTLVTKSGQHEALLDTKSAEEKILADLQEEQKRRLLIAKHAEDRRLLKKGDPCPLCGSREHPWAGRTVGQDDTVDESVHRQKEQLERVSSRVTELSGILSALAEKKNTCTSDKKIAVEERSLLEKTWKEICTRIGEETAPGDKDAVVARLEETGRRCESLQSTLRKIKETIHTRNRSAEEAAAAYRTKSEQEISCRQAENSLKQAQADERRLEEECSSLSGEIDNLKESIQNRLAVYGADIPAPEKEPGLAASLQKRLESFRLKTAEVAETDKKLSIIEEKQKAGEQSIRGQEKSHAGAAEVVRETEVRLEGLIKERKAILGDSDPSDVRSSLDKDRRRLSENLQGVKDALAATSSDISTAEKLLKTSRTAYAERSEKHRQALVRFETRLMQAGFSDTQSFREALIEEETFAKLEALQKDFDKRQTEAAARLKDIRKKLVHEQEKKRSDASLEEIQQAVAEKKARLDQLQQDRGGIKKSLSDQEDLHSRQQELLKQIQAQQKECYRWENLNRLIGSADGKKFRRFAQGVTLDCLIEQANRHLWKLNDRYILKRTEDEQLGLQVVDTYQADVTRPVSTLSGGETFLASLALALGLSGLAGRNTSIDSLFLDEGFGTLDPDTLEVALAALNTLHASGKTIGIISHVDALKERIPVQIAVQKRSGGVSTLNVIGC